MKTEGIGFEDVLESRLKVMCDAMIKVRLIMYIFFQLQNE